jgi:arylsulfatase A-like enzyme
VFEASISGLYKRGAIDLEDAGIRWRRSEPPLPHRVECYIRRPMPPATRWLSLVAALCAMASCSTEVEGEDEPRRSVVFISIDTLREDHMGRSGHARQTTPYLDRLASEGVYFQHCYAQCSWTLPSMLSLFSSLSPPVFGVEEGIQSMPRDLRRVPGGKGYRDVLAEHFSAEHVMLTEVLAKQGYRTAGFSTNGHLTRGQGFAQGFEAFDANTCLWGSANCAYQLATKWLDAHLVDGDDAPFFLWVHLFDPHFTEYGEPPIYAVPSGYESRFSAEDAGASPVEERTGRAYDRRIRYADDRTREFVEGLRQRGVLDEVLLVVAADHGDELNEDGRWGHSRSVRNSLVHVPLILRFPQARWSSVFDAAVSNLDVAPTLLKYLGLPVPAAMEGQSLLAAIQGEAFTPRPVYGDTRRFGLDLRYLIDPSTDRKLVLDRASGARQLFSLREDPGERRDLAATESERADELEARLRQWIAEMEARSAGSEVTRTLSDEGIETLRSLGYIQ